MSPRRSIRLAWFLSHRRRLPVRIERCDKALEFVLGVVVAVVLAVWLVSALSDCTRAAAWC